MKEQRILAIDQGTSGSKAIVFSAEGDILASRTADYAIAHPKPGYVEIDPEELLASVRNAVGGALEDYGRAGGSAEDIITIGVSNQRESFLLWDGNGTALSPVVVWQCKRSVEYCGELSADAHLADTIRKRTGLLIDPYFSGTKAAVLAAGDETLRERIAGGEAFFGTVDSWLAWKLTGGAVHASDRSNASRTMLFDINRLEWDEEIIGRVGLAGLRMPEVRSSDAGFGSTDLGGLLPRAVPIGAMIGDSHAAAFGEGLFRPGEAKVTLGTGSSILMNVGAQRAESTNGMVSTICWSSGDRTDYALEGIIVSCGSTITWLRDKLQLFAESREIDELAESVDDAGGVYLVPGFSGLGAPWWKLDAKASLVGLDFGHDRRHVARAALESIPFQVADVLGAMADDAGGGLTAVKADGGITVSDFVTGAVASLADCPVHIPSMKEASAWGAALLAGLNAGLYADLDAVDDLIRSRKTRIVEPGPDEGLAGRYAGWRALLAEY